MSTQRITLTEIAMAGALTLLAGCERRPPDTSSKTPPQTAIANIPAVEEASDSIAAMVHISAGTFMMGDKDEIDASLHEVVLSAFYIDTHLVTQEQYEKVMDANPSRWKGDLNPVEQVRWSDAVRYCNKRSELEGLELCYNLETWECNFDSNGYRLPTEAEWEYACRAGSDSPYFFGEEPSRLGDYAWFEDNSDGRPRPVGQKKPNPWGLYDICGNVWEWCNDFYKVDYYQEADKENPRGPADGETKVVRGGAWRFSDESCRSGYRYNENPGYADVCFGYDIYGFRCVRMATASNGS